MKPLVIAMLLSSISLGYGNEWTFNEHIAPMIHQNCTTCHRPGAAGPFSLITYEEVRKKARTIQRTVESRYMPPWHPVNESVKFAHDRRLSEKEIMTLVGWIESGMAEGSGVAPKFPQFADGWQLGQPDLIVSMAEAFPIPAEGPDIYRNFALKLDLEEDKWVRAVEMRPGTRTVVHHSLLFLDNTGTAVEMDGKDGKPGFRGMGFRRSGSLGAYVPGSTARFLPEDLALALPKGSDIVLSTHFHPTGKPEEERSFVGIYFAEKPPSRPLANIQVPPAFGRGMGIDIPAGEKAYRITDRFTLPVEVDAFSVGGHAHYLCKEMKMTAKWPDGNELVLIQIDNWDLNWQDRYYFAETLRLPAGTVLVSELLYDNSAENPANPFHPPRRIRWGHESTDEMGSITLMVAPTSAADQEALTRASRMKQVEVLGSVAQDLRGTAAMAVSQRIAQLDQNSDGKIQSTEIPQKFRRQAIMRFDRDRDDAIDKTELGELLEAMRNGNLGSQAEE